MKHKITMSAKNMIFLMMIMMMMMMMMVMMMVMMMMMMMMMMKNFPEDVSIKQESDFADDVSIKLESYNETDDRETILYASSKR